jgi:hypothetical protein
MCQACRPGPARTFRRKVSEPIVWLKALRSSVAPEAAVKALADAKTFAAPAWKVPASTSVAPV